jgi:RNA polymerase sigma-70 factor (ECF subfamily)
VEDHHTTLAVQRYLDELAGVRGDAPAEPIVRDLLARSAHRLQLLCGALLHRSYPRLTQGPLNLGTDELLGGLVERLIKAMREVRPGTVRQFFALANQHMRWELNDLARQLDHAQHAVALQDWHAAPAHSAGGSASGSETSATAKQILDAIEELPQDERETFNLVRLQGLSQSEAASILGVCNKTIQRRLNRGLMLLSQRVHNIVPTRPQGQSPTVTPRPPVIQQRPRLA